MKILLQSILLSLPILLLGQTADLSVFNNLVDRTWQANGSWGNGSPFSQEITFRFALDSSIVVAESIGFVDEEHSELGLRNHGIRQVDKNSNVIKFWEFDVFGGLTKGLLTVQGMNIMYQYHYGDSNVTDMWEYVDDSTYNFIVGEYDQGEWKQTYLSTQFKALSTLEIEEVYSLAKEHLLGNWTSPAWEGRLNESWSIGKDGHLIQSAEYIKDQKVLFESNNKIEIVNDELILLSVIKGSNPKIFKATEWSSDSITFENSDYINPNKVVYLFSSNDEFQRSISGTENDQASKYTFNFKSSK